MHLRWQRKLHAQASPKLRFDDGTGLRSSRDGDEKSFPQKRKPSTTPDSVVKPSLNKQKFDDSDSVDMSTSTESDVRPAERITITENGFELDLSSSMSDSSLADEVDGTLMMATEESSLEGILGEYTFPSSRQTTNSKAFAMLGSSPVPAHLLEELMERSRAQSPEHEYSKPLRLLGLSQPASPVTPLCPQTVSDDTITRNKNGRWILRSRANAMCRNPTRRRSRSVGDRGRSRTKAGVIAEAKNPRSMVERADAFKQAVSRSLKTRGYGDLSPSPSAPELYAPFLLIGESQRYAGASRAGPIPFDLESILRNPVFYRYFARHLRHELAFESILFWSDVEMYRSSPSLSTAEALYDAYVDSKSDRAINVMHNISEGIKKNLDKMKEAARKDPSVEADRMLFDAAQRSVVNMLKEDSFVRFRQSPLWSECVDELESSISMFDS